MRDMIEDGFGGYWARCQYEDCDLHVVRPGKVQCSNCDTDELRAMRDDLRARLVEAEQLLRRAQALVPNRLGRDIYAWLAGGGT